MKFILGVIVGFLVGYQLGRRAVERPEAISGAAAQGRKLMGSAARIGVEAVHRARSRVQSRLGGNGEAAWD